MKPFTLNNGNCLIEHCKSYNDYKCVTCNCGYYLSNAGICKKIETGCVRYQRGECTDCLPNFRLKGSQCEVEGCEELKDMKCVKCSSNFDLINDGCQMKNCEAWKDGNCEICKPGYNLRRGVCVLNQSVESL